MPADAIHLHAGCPQGNGPGRPLTIRQDEQTGAKAPSTATTLLDTAAVKDNTHRMLFMVIETFKGGDPDPAGERFARHGRMLPDGVVYEVSWLEVPSGARCWQVMQAPDRATLDVWIARWSDVVDFEVVPVLTSKDFWAQRQAG